MTMLVRRRGRQPHEGFAMVPWQTARDCARLSWDALGILTYLLSQRPGWSITTADVTKAGRSGRDAVRDAFAELETLGYIRRTKGRDERGTFTYWIDLYPYGDAEEESSEGVEIPEGSDQPEPDPENQGTDFQAPVNQAYSSRTSSVEDHSTSPSLVVAAPQTDLTTQVSRDKPTNSPTVPSSGQSKSLPLVRRRQLMNAGVTETAGPQWELAWTTVTSMEWPQGMESEAEHYPDEHLAQHILQAVERGHPLSPSRWVQFYIDDRQRQIGYARARLEQEARMAEDPNEREARQNRHLPPDRSDLDRLCWGCGCDTSTEPHKDGCRATAKAGVQG